MKQYKSMRDIRNHNPKFFSEEAMDFFQCELETGVLKQNLFITSETPKGSTQRRFTVRRAMRARVDDRYYPFINTVGGFGEHATKKDAMVAARAQRKLLELRGKALVEEMVARVSSEGQAFGITALAEVTRGYTLMVSTLQDVTPAAMECVTYESLEEAARVLGDGEGAMSPEWVGTLIERTVMADEMKNASLIFPQKEEDDGESKTHEGD